jgi:signal transduction histidine kinase
MKRMLSQDIVAAGKRRGELTIWYCEDEEFLNEEKHLIKEIANKIAVAIEKHDLESACSRYVRTLEDLVLEKTKEIEESNKRNQELKELSDQLHESQKELVTFFTAITDTIVVVDPSLFVTVSNKKSIGNGKCHKQIFGRDTPCEDCPAKRVFEQGTPVSSESKIDNKYYQFEAYPIKNETGEVSNVLVKCSDITKEKQIETHLIQSYKLASLGKLVAGIAHEINNPNTFIQGNLRILGETINDALPILDAYAASHPSLQIARLSYPVFKESVPPLIDDMIEGVARIKKIVDGLKNFARKNEGLMDDEIDMNTVVGSSLRLVENQIRKHAEISLSLADSLPVFKGNIQKLEQVIVNMLINASEAITGPSGKIRIETGLINSDEYVRITDNGAGIEESDLKYIYDPFFTTKRNHGGTGLGLSISYGIIKEHKGRIDVESAQGKGTAFTIRIPWTLS